MIELVKTCADFSIRRACAFVGLAVVTVMMALSYDIPLAFRSGAQIMALLVLALVATGWRAPHRDLRHSETYFMLRDQGVPRQTLAEAETRAAIGQVLRERLWWHAERVAAVSLVLWGLSLGIALFSPAAR